MIKSMAFILSLNVMFFLSTTDASSSDVYNKLTAGVSEHTFMKSDDIKLFEDTLESAGQAVLCLLLQDGNVSPGYVGATYNAVIKNASPEYKIKSIGTGMGIVAAADHFRLCFLIEDRTD